MPPLKINEDGTLPMWIDPATGRRYLEPAVETAVLGGGDGGGPHTHPEADVTNLTADLAAKAPAAHNHDASYAPTHSHPYAGTVHSHAESDVTSLTADLAGKAPSVHAHSYEASGAVAAHAAASDPHPAYATDADLTAHAATPHGGAASQAFPVGSWFFAGVSTNPATLLGYGTWARVAQGRMPVGQDPNDTAFDVAGETGGAKTHSHTVTQPDAHAALTHAGTAVADHTVTQPAAGSESAHTHTYTQVVNHVHVQSVNSATTGSLSGYTPDTSTGTSVASGYSTANPTGGVASGTTAAGSAHTHTLSGAAVSAHGVTQPSQHGSQSHTGTAVADGSTLPPYIVVYIWERTA